MKKTIMKKTIEFSPKGLSETYDGDISTLLDEFRDMDVYAIIPQWDKGKIICYLK